MAQSRSFAEFILSPFASAQGRSQVEGERAQDDVAQDFTAPCYEYSCINSLTSSSRAARR
jgi:hypothetical protein